MAISKEVRKLEDILHVNELTECLDNIQISTTKLSSEIEKGIKRLIEKLKRTLAEYIENPSNWLRLIAGTIGLMQALIPISLTVNISCYGIVAVLRLCAILTEKTSNVNVMEVIEKQRCITLRKEARATVEILTASLRFLKGMHKGKLNDHEIFIIQSHVPVNLGTEFIGKLEDKIRELLRAGTYGEKEEETLHRCNRIVRHIDRYCILSCLRELVISYLVTIFINNGVPQNITDSYLERREQFKDTREELLKVLYRPDPRDACVAASFSHTKWSLLSELIEAISESNDVIGRRLEISSASDSAFFMFRHDPETINLFTIKRYVRVMRYKATIFIFTHLAQNREFRIHPEYFPDYQWRISGEENAELKAIDGSSTDECTSFIITKLSNGKVMFSPKAHPTVFIKMKKADDDARLCVENNGYHSNCQWWLMKAS